MPGCAVCGCTNNNQKTKGTGIRYFSFPKDPDLINKWIIACKRKDKINLKYACVCSQHFNESSYHLTLRQKLLNYIPQKCRTLKADAIPTENLPNCLGDEKVKSDLNKTFRHKSQSRKIPASDLFNAKTLEKGVSPIVVRVKPVPNISNVSAALDVDQHTEIECLKHKIEQLEKENYELKIKVDQLVRENKLILKAAKKSSSEEVRRVRRRKSFHPMVKHKYRKQIKS